jgi:sugar porter (SP) family MFS transporter
LLFGYDTGVIAGALLYIQKTFTISPAMSGVVVGAVLVGAMVGVLIGVPLVKRFGRKALLLISAVVFAVGAFVSAIAPGIGVLIGARVVLGIAIGASSAYAPVYVAELAPPASRGMLVSLFQFFVTVGILVAYLIDFAFAHIGAWRWMLGLGALPAIVLFGGMLIGYESPRWLLEQGRDEAAREILSKLRTSAAEVTAEIREIKDSLAQQLGGRKELLSRRIRPVLVIAVLIGILQQATGINAIIYYMPTIFRTAGFSSDVNAILATLGVGTVNVLATIVALALIDRVGRRPLLLTGLVGMLVTLIVLAILIVGNQSGASPVVSLICVFVYIIAFAVSSGPVCWLMPAELFPLSCRSQGIGVTTFFNWGANFAVSFTFPVLLAHLGGGVFWIYAGFSIVGWLFVYFYVPETKGRSLEEIEAFWRHEAAEAH